MSVDALEEQEEGSTVETFEALGAAPQHIGGASVVRTDKL